MYLFFYIIYRYIYNRSSSLEKFDIRKLTILVTLLNIFRGDHIMKFSCTGMTIFYTHNGIFKTFRLISWYFLFIVNTILQFIYLYDNNLNDRFRSKSFSYTMVSSLNSNLKHLLLNQWRVAFDFIFSFFLLSLKCCPNKIKKKNYYYYYFVNLFWFVLLACI